MRCPICKREVEPTGNPCRPFCSERCRMLDLEGWLSERYRIASQGDGDTDGAGTTDPEASEAFEARLD